MPARSASTLGLLDDDAAAQRALQVADHVACLASGALLHQGGRGDVGQALAERDVLLGDASGLAAKEAQ
ncbi:MAG: hypothetical protein WKF33_07035 [Thermoleophilaceae bacterium]